MIKGEPILSAAVQAVIDKKGIRPVILDLREVSSMTDYFLIVSGSSSRQAKALMDSVDEAASKLKVNPLRTEGARGGRWILMDYGDFIVHIFDEESRRFYDLERLWRQAPTIEAEPAGKSEP